MLGERLYFLPSACDDFFSWKILLLPVKGFLLPGAGLGGFSFSRRRVSLPAPGLPPGAGSPPGAGWSLPPFPSAGWKLSSLAGRKTSNRGDIQIHTVCLLLSSGRQSLHSLLTAPGWRGARFDSIMTPGYSKVKAQISFSVERCISAMRWRIIKEQQRCWLLLAFRFRAYTPAL